MSPPTHSLSLDEARRLALRRQGLGDEGCPPQGKEGVAQTIERLGYVQIDTISVVARAHHQTLWARCPDYHPSMLHDLLAVDRRVFEFWGHAASYLPISDYRFYMPQMLRSPASDRGRQWVSENREIMNRVLKRIEKEGPLACKDFARTDGRKGGAWWDWKPAKMALEMLLMQGRLMVAERRNFQRIYDLTERVLPKGVDSTAASEDDVRRFLVRRALSSYGVATGKEVREHIGRMDLRALRTTIEEMQEEKEIIPVSIEGRPDLICYALPGALEPHSFVDAARCRLLCPFDNLIILRDRTQWLFGFEYTLECYVPAKKRVWGYFVFPILMGERLIGRLDPKADRKTKTLRIRALVFERWVTAIDDVLEPLAGEIARFARFNGCASVEFDTIRPAGHKRELKALVRAALQSEA